MRWLLEDGFFRIMTIRGAPLKLHWSFFLTALFFGKLSPPIWLAYFLVIALHELGHAGLVWWCGHPVIELQVHGLGGVCRYTGFTTPYEEALISWGGVWAQGIVYIVASLALSLAGPIESEFLTLTLLGLTTVNLRIMLFNLIPVPGFDGASAWRLFPLLWSHAQFEARSARARKARQTPALRVVPPLPSEPPPPPPDPVAARAKDELFDKILRDLDRAPQHVKDEEP